MKTATTLLLIFLVGCSSAPEPCDANTPTDTDAAVDAGIDATPDPPPGFFTARAACTAMGHRYRLGELAGQFNTCTPDECPIRFSFDARFVTLCSPEDVEACLGALDARADGCAEYHDVIATECAAILCVEIPRDER